MKRVLIADSELIMREGVKQVVSSMPECRVADEVSNVVGAMKLVRQGGIDLLLMASAPSGLGTARTISDLLGNDPDLPILILGHCDELQTARRAFLAGARGFVSARSHIQQIQTAILQVAVGGHFISPQVRERMILETFHSIDTLPHAMLSPRELEIFAMLTTGKTITHIAKYLHLSAKTVSTHKTRILARMNLSSVSELIQYAIAHNLLGRS